MEQSTVASKLDELEKSYRIPESAAVKEFLAGYPELVDLLLEAYPHIELQFGRGAVVELRFPRGWEYDSEKSLLARIRDSFTADDGLDRWDRLWDGWWGEASGRPGAWRLTIGTEPTGELDE